MRTATCHPGRRHHAKGQCNVCYRKARKDADPARYSAYAKKSRGNNLANRTRNSVEWAKRNPERAYSNLLKSKFGITLSDYREMLRVQGGGCKVCGRTQEQQTNRKLVVDHCHTTGRVRGVLCIRCNSALGMAGDSPERLQKLAEYLKESRCQQAP